MLHLKSPLFLGQTLSANPKGFLSPMNQTLTGASARFSGNSGTITPQEVVARIDHTKLTFKPGEDEQTAIGKLCTEARDSWKNINFPKGFYAVCVRPRHIALAKSELASTPIRVATVIGFPLDKVEQAAELKNPTVGNFSTFSKIQETCEAVKAGADEIDLVMNVGLLKQDAKNPNGFFPLTLNEFEAIQEAAQGRPVKVIIETDLLTDQEIVIATRLCHRAGFAPGSMVKTSTGMVNGGPGATPENVALIAKTLDEIGSPLGIKASKGVRTMEQATAIMKAGNSRVARIGTSSGVEIQKGVVSKQEY